MPTHSTAVYQPLPFYYSTLGARIELSLCYVSVFHFLDKPISTLNNEPTQAQCFSCYLLLPLVM